MTGVLILAMSTQRIGWSKLSKAWGDYFVIEGQRPATVIAALARTMPLLEDPNAVPFVCCYRQDVITPSQLA
jgi:hypothetical protein